MPTPADISVYGEDGQLQALVELKAKPRATKTWAAELRRNIFTNDISQRAPYYLIVSPSSVFVWSDISNPLELVAPDQELSLAALLGKSWSDLASHHMYEQSLELAVTSWLSRLTNGQTGDSPEYQALQRTGFVDAVRNGRIEPQGLL